MTRNLKFHEKIYLGESIEPRKVDKLKRKLRFKPFLAQVYLIVPARNPNDMLDIFDARQLSQKYYEKEAFFVLGIAGNHAEALRIVECMVQDCLKERGDCQLREYLLC